MSHETVIAARMIEEAEKQGKVIGIKVELGELGHVPPEELLECLTRLRPDWKIDHEITPATAECECGWKGHPTILERGHDHYLVECPECGETPEVTGGTHAKLVSVTIE